MIKTNSIDKVLSYNNHWKPSEATFSVSQLASSSEYQLWLAFNKTPSEYVTDISNNVNSVIGSGFHLIAEQAMADEPNVLIEHQMLKEIDGHWISGTCDLIRENTEYGVVFEDWKTMGVFQAKKLLAGEYEDKVIQLSLYRYLYSIDNPQAKLSDYGLINMFVTGDAGYFNKADGGGKVPKFAQVPIKLWSLEKTLKFIKYKLEMAKNEPVFDCADWQCDYCNLRCDKRKT